MAEAVSSTSAGGGGGAGYQLFRQTDSNKRGIPEAIFIESVEAICTGGVQPTQVVAQLQELYSKYQYMQSSLVAQRASLKTKLPDISSALGTVNHLIEQRDKAEQGEREYTYQLSENIWSTATVAPSDVVCLWLGAQCMLEYKLDEALELLQTNEENAKKTLASLDEDMAFLRDQLTTTEVNIARAHNYAVKLRTIANAQSATAPQSKKEAAGDKDGAEAAGTPEAQ
mmetsp:Transcript_65321/g.156146  ORF Transcript_65321/g.156146 Transcript_65321/m.156146 type:complete len:227 (+) Transcript_65321:92-772(+)